MTHFSDPHAARVAQESPKRTIVVAGFLLYTAPFPTNETLTFDMEEIAEWRWFTPQEALELHAFPATQALLRHIFASN